MTVCINGPLREFIAAKTGEHGAYENISEFVRDLILRRNPPIFNRDFS